MAGRRPRSRQRNVTGSGKSIKRRGSGLGTGRVGSTGGYQGRPGKSSLNFGGRKPESSDGEYRGSGGRSYGSGGCLKYIIILVFLIAVGGGGLGGLFSGGLGDMLTGGGQSGGVFSQYGNMESVFESLGGGNVSNGWIGTNNTGDLNTSVDSRAREKYTDIAGDGKDEVTIMVYLCGTDLESRSKMATSDLQEMINADLSDKINLLVYTGGCKMWQNNVISSSTNQIWQVKDDGVVCLEKNLGSKSMTDAATLTSFIKWCRQNYPANRNSLIFWDHGGGSVSGFGYDEKFPSSGSMSLAEIDQALTASGVKFDFVGFDACLMATAENALMLTEHADYLIASEETEPGIGWYYTDWLTELSKNTSMSTLEIGKNIIDDFVMTCNQKCPGQSTTLSIVDLAELEATLPEAFVDFSNHTYNLIENEKYAVVSNARSDAREFGASSKIDQVDLVHLAKNMDTKEGEALAQVLLNAVKYNRTSSNMTNSYGLSIYFPFRKASMVDDAVETYNAIGMDEEYAKCIQAFATVEVAGQAVNGGTTIPAPSLFDMIGGGSSSYGNSQMIGQLLESFLGGNVSSVAGLNSGNTNFLNSQALSTEDLISYFSRNAVNPEYLAWTEGEEGLVIQLPEEQWEQVQTLQANMFYDDGEGYIDLGLDTLYEFDSSGNLLAPEEFTWLAINQQPVAYYHESTVDDGENYSIIGRIPVLYNGMRGELVVEFTDEDPYGSVTGVRRIYTENETLTVAKTMNAIEDGDVIDFVCDYYSYDGEYLDSYKFGDQLIVDGELTISDVYVDESSVNLTYLFTDIYNQKYWTEPVPVY